jgi:predicted GNAT family acetyltransferase
MTNTHPLDRPVWSMLTGRQSHLAVGDKHALRLAPDFGLFAAAADTSTESRVALSHLVPAAGAIATVGIAEPTPGPGISTESHVLWQMVCDQLTDIDREPDFEIHPLSGGDAPQMLALATLTKPGPFFARTHELGDFVGVLDNGGLLAMAGERMKLEGFTEVSGVCTAPSVRGRGYAGALMRVVAQAILARGEVPFLHSYAHNTGAIALYESLGFRLRRELTMTLLTRVG